MIDGSLHALIVLLVPAHSMLLYQRSGTLSFPSLVIPNPGFIPKTYQNPYAFNNPYLKDCDTLYVFYLLNLYTYMSRFWRHQKGHPANNCSLPPANASRCRRARLSPQIRIIRRQVAVCSSSSSSSSNSRIQISCYMPRNVVN